MDIASDLINFAMEHGIAVELRRDLSPNIPSIALPQIKKSWLMLITMITYFNLRTKWDTYLMMI
ncbi:hypothetical protein WFA24289_00446 [Periweissella fabaria]|uniref:Uncharacterized protein n=1 Tax=Periweissella fabaria TaxID=546157 RepID=A0ABM8Z4C0_9LACO|nr:hypothetical protein WFA24289_00446 [Periweissella fabaria]